jgi:hypothetical protein
LKIPHKPLTFRKNNANDPVRFGLFDGKLMDFKEPGTEAVIDDSPGSFFLMGLAVGVPTCTGIKI